MARCDFASMVDVEVPRMRAVVEIASLINCFEYFKTGRSVTRMGIEKMSKAELVRLVDCGDVRPNQIYEHREVIGHL